MYWSYVFIFELKGLVILKTSVHKLFQHIVSDQ